MQTLVHKLSDILHEPPSSVEILPGDIEEWSLSPDFPVLYREGNLGVPQKVLYRLYLSALPIFKTSRSNLRDLDQLSDEDTRMTLNSTAIIILANPAHQTAFNARKRLVEAGRHSVLKELEYTRNLLCSNRESAKQSIAWDHRRWLLQTLHLHDSLNTASNERSFEEHTILVDVLRRELDLVIRCSETYPRNYHAWNHWHFCLEMACHAPAADQQSECSTFLSDAFSRLKSWVEKHVSDYSAIHQLCNMVRVQNSTLRHSGLMQRDATPTACFEHAMTLVSRYPDHESLWMYLRVTCVMGESRMAERIYSLPDSELRQRCISWLTRPST